MSTESAYQLQEGGRFRINNYSNTHPFSNFLPGIAGIWGVPLWVFYVNRGQGVISFGLENKDHSIGEFFPANKAYAFASTLGFRTFLKINKNTYYEPFRLASVQRRDEQMVITSDALLISEVNPCVGLQTNVKYFTIPHSPVGGLVRQVTVTNISKKPMNLELVDGLPRIVPFGSSDLFLKCLTRTLEAWMHSHTNKNLGIFRLIVDPTDVSQTRPIEGANFMYSFYQDKNKEAAPYVIVDPSALFGQDTSYILPTQFCQDSFALPLEQVTCGKTPCAFSHCAWTLQPQEAKTLYSIFGASFKLDLVRKFVRTVNEPFIKQKEVENEQLIENIKTNALSVSGSEEFSQYLKSTYLDNVLRGGYPYSFDTDQTYYVFSRKHGDLERDYNKFRLLPSYFSEGESNYRDINQNRRVDLFFNPSLGRKNITYFLNFIRIDGYNPLVIQGEKLFLTQKNATALLHEWKLTNPRLLELMLQGFYLGEFFQFLEEEGVALKNRDKLVEALGKAASREPIAAFGEGFWIDHWRYNLDLIESFLYFYPDQAIDLFSHKDFCFWDDEFKVKDRHARYVLHGDKVFQWNALVSIPEKRAVIDQRKRFKNFLRTKRGVVYKTSLSAKLLSLILSKAATIDPHGIGIEMEADKPGWCDSLNGLPALFGSSVCETLELKRACVTLMAGLSVLYEAGIHKLSVAEELFSFFNRLNKLIKEYHGSQKEDRDYFWWDRSNTIKEDFRRTTFNGVSGDERELGVEKLERFLKRVIDKLDQGIKRATDKATDVPYTYFMYTVSSHVVKNKVIIPLAFKRQPLSLFLEGPMHALRVNRDTALYHALRKTALYDQKLAMYKLNTSLKDLPLEIGRSRIFVPGWLENESVWLHMEYKYLLEVLKSGMYKEFYRDFHNCCVSFFDPDQYGRNILENSSFIVSSAYPDKALWGKGFVARLSGATVELLNIWIYLCMGKQPFFLDERGQVCLQFAPILAGDLFTKAARTVEINGEEVTFDAGTFAFKLFSSILVVYHNPERKNTFTKDCKVEKVVIQTNGKKKIIKSGIICHPDADLIRNVGVDRIDIYLT